jgi:hypothetical protein
MKHNITWTNKWLAVSPNAFWAPWYIWRTEWFRTNADFRQYVEWVDNTGAGVLSPRKCKTEQ